MNFRFIKSVNFQTFLECDNKAIHVSITFCNIYRFYSSLETYGNISYVSTYCWSMKWIVSFCSLIMNLIENVKITSI